MVTTELNRIIMDIILYIEYWIYNVLATVIKKKSTLIGEEGYFGDAGQCRIII